MIKPTIPQLAKGFLTSEFLVVLLIVVGVDVDTAAALFGGIPDAEQIKAVLAMLHGENWQSLLIKGAIAAGYLWIRRDIKQAGIQLEVSKNIAEANKAMASSASLSYAYPPTTPCPPEGCAVPHYDADLTQEARP